MNLSKASEPHPGPHFGTHERDEAGCKAAGHGYPCHGSGYCYFCGWVCRPDAGPTKCAICCGPACPSCGCDHSNIVDCVGLADDQREDCGAACGCADPERAAEIVPVLMARLREAEAQREAVYTWLREYGSGSCDENDCDDSGVKPGGHKGACLGVVEDILRGRA